MRHSPHETRRWSFSQQSGVLYIGVTNNLQRRIFEHQQKLVEGFTKKYNVTRLVCYVQFGDIRDAIAREKQLKGWRRKKKSRSLSHRIQHGMT